MASATATVPVLDLTGLGFDRPGELARLGLQLRDALEQVGFFCIVGHGIAWAQVEDMYEQAARYHGLALATKAGHPLGPKHMGYNPMQGEQITGNKPSLNAAFFMGRPGSPRNQFPAEGDLPGFRAAAEAYYASMERLCHDVLLPIYAAALDLPAPHFQPFFEPSLATVRLSHYPPVPAEDNQWGIDPHTDAGFMTLLPSNPVPGLWIRPDRPGTDWFEPCQEPESFVVNSGDMLRRWTNNRFLSTLHRVLNVSGKDRYALPYFYDPRVDTVIACLETCTDVTNPPQHESIVYGDYLKAFMGRSYTQVREPLEAAR